ncbi:MAG TPA: hypothetical protein VMK12_28090 [Anaeromyxobacteraceae bacterium]|nr:hypothetical protein [Anaeromyxobacteraceae bacterium]
MVSRRFVPRSMAMLWGAYLSAALPAPAWAQQLREAPAAYAEPVSDPGDRFSPREPRITSGLERVIAKAAAEPSGPKLVSLLTPDLTPTMELELRQAFPQCAWKPTLEPGGEPAEVEFTFLRAGQK